MSTAREQAVRAAALLACSALDIHPYHADTCLLLRNLQQECTCWRREVYAASVALALTGAGES